MSMTEVRYYYNLYEMLAVTPETVTYTLSPELTPTNNIISQYSGPCTNKVWIDEPKQEPVKETAMSTEQNQIDYLCVRARNVKSNLNSKLWDQFNMYANNRPKTYKELIDAIKGGKFKLDEKRVKLIDAAIANDGEDDDFDFFNFGPFDGIIFDGPQPDEEGRAKAADELEKAYTKTMDAIKVLPAADGLKALQEFENWVPSNLPKN